MLKFLTRSKDYEDANIEGWIPDTGTGNSVADLTAADEAIQLASLQAAIRRLNIHNLNTGYMKHSVSTSTEWKRVKENYQEIKQECRNHCDWK